MSRRLIDIDTDLLALIAERTPSSFGRAWMRSRLIRLLDALRGSYWFLPTLMSLISALLAWVAVSLDQSDPDWIAKISWVGAAHPDGARQILSVIGGSMVTVAGTVFSVTIAAVVYASGQYGPRLLSNFMSDRGNQVTLGTFISTFVYCLLVLRTIRSADETGSSEFVPDLALMIALVLALCSIAVLIYFIHHVPSKLHINSVIADIGEKLAESLQLRFPESLGDAREQTVSSERERIVPAPFVAEGGSQNRRSPYTITKPASGYLQLIDDDTILEEAMRNDLVIRLHVQPGDFIHHGRIVADVWPADRCSENTRAAIAEALAVGVRRTPIQDIRFLIDELVEIAARALSPGVNDPFTAITCIDWLGAAIFDVALRDLPSHLRVDGNGDLRIVAYPVTFATLLDRSFGSLRQYCAVDALAAARYIDVLGEILANCHDSERIDCLQRHMNTFLTILGTKLTAGDLSQLRQRAQKYTPSDLAH